MAYLGKKPNKFIRSSNSGKMTFFNKGTPFEFNANWLVNVGTTRISMLELHKQEVLSRNSPDCFILDGFGEVVNCRAK